MVWRGGRQFRQRGSQDIESRRDVSSRGRWFLAAAGNFSAQKCGFHAVSVDPASRLVLLSWSARMRVLLTDGRREKNGDAGDSLFLLIFFSDRPDAAARSLCSARPKEAHGPVGEG